MTIFLILIGAVAASGIVASILAVSRDGYRKQPTRPLATTYRHSTDAAGLATLADARPADLVASQWLERCDSAAQPRRASHAAGAMVLRPW